MAKIETIQRLLESSNYREVIAAVDGFGPTTTVECAHLLVMRTEAMLALGDYSAEYVDRAIHLLRPTGETKLFALAKYLKSRVLLIGGSLHEALEELTESYVYYKRQDDQRGMGRAANLMSYIAFQQAEYAKFFELSRKCLEHYRAGNCDDQISMVLLNICTARFRSGQLLRAVSELRSIRADRYQNLTEDNKYNLYHLMALTSAQLGDRAAASRSMSKASKLNRELAREVFRHHEITGYVNILDGKYDAAEKALKQGLKLSLKIAPESALISQIKRLFGDLYVATEQWDKAEQFTNEGLEVAEKIGERVEIAACHRIFAQLEQHRGNDNIAREWFVKAIELFQLIGANYELAATRYMAAVSGLYDNGERQALLFMARRYFESEQVKPYLQKIDAALSTRTPSRNTKESNLVAPRVIAKSKVMTEIVSLCEHVAQANMTVFLTGPTGTGKDLLARYIHHHSGRTGEFVSVNAAAIPGPMIEAELFGHTKGAFTGSDGDRVGLLQQADGGTFYLNEIADATMEFQTKLLEVLETRQIRRLGENKNRPVDFRLIAATNHDLKQRIAEGKFRLDLYHRLNEIPIELPPLSDRRDDIPHLVEFFLEHEGCQVNGDRESHARLAFLLSIPDYDGHVRELRNHVEKLRHMSSGDVARMIDLILTDGFLSERDWLTRVLERTGGNRSQAARLMGVSEATIRKRLGRYCPTTTAS
ncbi:MAG: sigma 54-interacting transcriptional regulator [bacterium]